MSDGKPGRSADQFPLRLPDGMRERIKAAAAANQRSMNAEIIATLNEAYPPPGRLVDTVDALREVVREMRVSNDLSMPETALDAMLQDLILELQGVLASRKDPT